LAKFKYGAWEVDKTAMDVQAGDAGLRPDPSATATVERPGTEGQGQLFRDSYPTYADTDKIPAVRGPSAQSGTRPNRWLRFLVVLVALAVLAAGAALGLVKAGVIDKTGTNTPSAAQTTQHHATTTTPSKKPLVTPVSTGSGTATYRVAVGAYGVTVITSTGRSWVSIGAVGQRPTFAGIVASNSSQKAVLLGPSTVDIGAGGTKVIVTSGHRTFTLTPVSAPFSYQLITNS
jgi:hypothetical protein